MSISCHSRYCKALLVTSLNHVSSAARYDQIPNFTFSFISTNGSCDEPQFAIVFRILTPKFEWKSRRGLSTPSASNYVCKCNVVSTDREMKTQIGAYLNVSSKQIIVKKVCYDKLASDYRGGQTSDTHFVFEFRLLLDELYLQFLFSRVSFLQKHWGSEKITKCFSLNKCDHINSE